MPKPRKNKKYDPSKHHAPKEVHKLGQVEYAILAQLQESLIQINNAKANLLAKYAVDVWDYPTGQVLEFSINFQKNEVEVIMKGPIKDTPVPIADAKKE